MAPIMYKKDLCQWELTEKEWECLTVVSTSDVWGWLGWGKDNGPELFLGGRGGPLRLDLGSWYVKLDGCYQKKKEKKLYVQLCKMMYNIFQKKKKKHFPDKIKRI